MILGVFNLEIAVALLGLGVLLMGLWLPPERRRQLGYVAAAGVALVLVCSLVWPPLQLRLPVAPAAFQHLQVRWGDVFVLDLLALFFKRFFLLAAVFVLLLAAHCAGDLDAGAAEYYSLVLFALLGMMLAASACDFVMLFVALELITVAFYVLTSYQRQRVMSLEAGVKYLVLGAVASAFLVYGIALVYGLSGTMQFRELAARAEALSGQPLFLLGLVLVFAGLSFKIAAVPLQIWTPDVYQGAPTPTTAFLAVGSKAAGVVLLLRVLFSAVPSVAARGCGLLMLVAAATILYGNLCAIPQQNLKRMMGYSSMAHAGYVLLGAVAMAANLNQPIPGGSAILFHLGAYLFTVLGAFAVIALVSRTADADTLRNLSGLSVRSPLLAATLTLAMVSLAGIPPLAGFFGKFLLLKALVEQGPAYHWLVAVALGGMVVSLYYYFNVIRAVYWSPPPPEADLSPIRVAWPGRTVLYGCIAGMLALGVFPEPLLNAAARAATVFHP